MIRKNGLYQVRTKNGWTQSYYYYKEWKFIEKGLMVIEVQEAIMSTAGHFKTFALQQLEERLQWGIKMYREGYGYIPPEQFGLEKAIEILKSIEVPQTITK